MPSDAVALAMNFIVRASFVCWMFAVVMYFIVTRLRPSCFFLHRCWVIGENNP
jgi:hypothetical protein